MKRHRCLGFIEIIFLLMLNYARLEIYDELGKKKFGLIDKKLLS